MLNLEKTSFLPRINGLLSLLDSAQVISMGALVILIVILVRYAVAILYALINEYNATLTVACLIFLVYRR
jgi:hypothetical protein